PGPVFHTIVSIKNDGHYFCRAGGNRPDGLNEPVTICRSTVSRDQSSDSTNALQAIVRNPCPQTSVLVS
nr:hypothetical protein [Escherichia coli]MDN1562965.1 hypothetical protein [Escherichia coli]